MYQIDVATSREDLIERHMDLVRRIAHHLLGRLPATVQVQDLIQAGAMGLLEAAKQYDDSHGASFETYAGIRIRGAMLDEVRRLDWAPRSAHRAMREISEAIRAVESRLGRRAFAEEIAAELGVDTTAYHDMLRRSTESRVFSMADALGGDGDEDTLPGDTEDPAAEVQKGHLGKALAAAIGELSEREQLVLSLYYDEEMNLREIGETLGVTESRVCQIHGQALARLRAAMTDWKAGDAAPGAKARRPARRRG